MKSAKEAVANIAASAKSGMEKTKATVQEKAEKMTSLDPVKKEMATQKKEDRIYEAEREKRVARDHNAAVKHTGGGAHHEYTTGTGGATGGHHYTIGTGGGIDGGKYFIGTGGGTYGHDYGTRTAAGGKYATGMGRGTYGHDYNTGTNRGHSIGGRYVSEGKGKLRDDPQGYNTRTSVDGEYATGTDGGIDGGDYSTGTGGETYGHDYDTRTAAGGKYATGMDGGTYGHDYNTGTNRGHPTGGRYVPEGKGMLRDDPQGYVTRTAVDGEYATGTDGGIDGGDYSTGTGGETYGHDYGTGTGAGGEYATSTGGGTYGHDYSTGTDRGHPSGGCYMPEGEGMLCDGSQGYDIGTTTDGEYATGTGGGIDGGEYSTGTGGGTYGQDYSTGTGGGTYEHDYSTDADGGHPTGGRYMSEGEGMLRDDPQGYDIGIAADGEYATGTSGGIDGGEYSTGTDGHPTGGRYMPEGEGMLRDDPQGYDTGTAVGGEYDIGGGIDGGEYSTGTGGGTYGHDYVTGTAADGEYATGTGGGTYGHN